VWDDLGNPVIDKDGKQATKSLPRPKAEIREITHLHHALDAAVLGYVAMLLPRDGKLWEQIVTKKVLASEAMEFRKAFLWTGMLRLAAPSHGNGSHRLEVLDLPTPYKKTLADRLAECRVVKHVPSDMRGARLELKAWRVVSLSNGRVALRQRTFDPKNNDPETGARRRTWKQDDVPAAGVVGLSPGKLARARAALIISENFGVAVLDTDESNQKELHRVIPFHHVKQRLAELTALNNGVRPLLIRNGDTILVRTGSYAGRWRVFSVKNAKAGVMLDLGQPDTIKPLNKTDGHKINVKLASLLAGGLTVAGKNLTGG
jgi:CRISPR-associated endonuclease Csn1